MIAINIPSIPRVTVDEVVSFLEDTFGILKAFDMAYDLISNPKALVLDEDELELLEPEEVMMYRYSALIDALNFDIMDKARTIGWFTAGKASTKLYRGTLLLERLRSNLNASVMTGQADTLEEYRAQRLDLAYGMGDVIYAMYRIVQVDEYIMAAGSGEEVAFDPAISAYLNRCGSDFLEVADTLVRLQSKYPSVIPVYEDDLSGWENLTTKLDAATVETITDKGEYIYPIDMRAFKLGILAIDDAFLEILERRAADTESFQNLFPDEWLQFQTAVPDKFIELVLQVEFKLLLGIVQPILEDEPFDATYVALLERLRDNNSLDDMLEEDASSGKTAAFKAPDKG